MTIHAALHHVTRYTYARPVMMGPQIVRLRPAPHARTTAVSYSLKIEPAEHFINWQQDPFGNYLARLVFPKPTTVFSVSVDLVAEMRVVNPFDFFLEESAEQAPFDYAPELKHDLAPYLATLPLTPLLETFIADIPLTPKIATNDFIVELNRRVQQEVAYIVRMEPGVQTPEETLTSGKGSCRDSAWLLVQVARNIGLAARFASGYLIQLAADEKALDGPSGTEIDFTDLHAWAEIYLPGAGWIGLDATSGLLTGEGHIPLACTPDPSSAAPVTGGFAAVHPGEDGDDEVEVEFGFEMTVTRIKESPRTTKPYSEETWARILTCGDQVERDLTKHDVRLTTGGEPTFISIDDYEGDEWNTGALGERKRDLGGKLVKKLQHRFAPGSLLHYGQGKWYPGEPLPRWALNCYWRKDGVPIWQQPDLIADMHRPTGADAGTAERFISALADRLDVAKRWAIPAFEDAWYHMWRERRLPVNVEPNDAKLDDKLERERLANVFKQGLGSVVGFALPLRRGVVGGGGSQWESGPWFLRDERLMLLPGDSAMGFRMPLDSLPWASKADREDVIERDPMAPRPALSVTRRMQSQGNRNAAVPMTPKKGESAGSLTRTAICIEPRSGHLNIFTPPIAHLEDYLELVAAIEDVAASLKQPVAIEGYKPPSDHRLNVLSVTPDPGVIEVNVHPARSWRETVAITTGVYEDARNTRLGTEKFQLDGRLTGTGGGNHITLGGATPADSPFLRRPDVLRSLVSYWHNHPALSYLFSGLFIGPTSQAPRADEARTETIYELETALQQLPDRAVTPPWLVDRVMRHLLIDMSGNTHRAEFSIDKLYSPDSASGRLGILELRAFEMPPHARMSLAQQLLVRSLVSRFWQQPYHAKLERWGTLLHDRFLLPHWVDQDFNEVLSELDEFGYPFEQEWFQPFSEFRFPKIGNTLYRGIDMELRHALEPWNVLGEEQGAGGTARYVDSSIERIQVKVAGLTESRHLVMCNGKPVPLHPTGVAGEFVAGVRFRAWQPESCLHPTIGVQLPLVFDLVDRWSGRAVAGATYHVSHPGGRAAEKRPMNHNEAEGRRIARFAPRGHTPGAVTITEPRIDRDYPFTLDLRRS